MLCCQEGQFNKLDTDGCKFAGFQNAQIAKRHYDRAFGIGVSKNVYQTQNEVSRKLMVGQLIAAFPENRQYLWNLHDFDKKPSSRLLGIMR